MSNTSVTVKVEMTRNFCDIFFRVVDKAAKAPIAGAKIEVSLNGEPVNDYVTDAEGKATCADMPGATEFDYVCSAAGYQTIKGKVTTV